MKKALFCTATILLVLFSGFAAGKADGNASESRGSAAGGTLVIGEYILDTQMAAKNPFLPNNTKIELLPLIYETLLYFNPVNGQLENAIAAEYAWNANYTELTFTIQKGITWHDGKPVTAEDVAFTYNTLKKEPILDIYKLWNKLASVTAEGDKVIFKLSAPLTSLPFYASSIYIVPKHIWETIPVISQEINAKPVGSGPFVFKSYTVGTDVQYDANKAYWRGAPKVDRMVIQMFNSSPNLTLALLRGDVAASMNTIVMPSIPEFKSKPYSKMQIYNGLGNFVVAINHENPLLADVNVRKAMIMAVNQNDLVTKGEYGGVYPTSPGFLPGLFGNLQSQSAVKAYTYDPKAAMELLEKAGYKKGNDGIYAKNGKRLSFTYHNASGAPAQQMEAGMIQQWLLNIGIEIIPRLATWPELTQLLQRGDYDLLQNGINFPPDPYAALNTSFNSAMTAPKGMPTSGTNYFRYRNAEVDELLAQVSITTDVTKQKELYVKIQDKIAADAVFIPMYNGSGHVPYYDGGKYGGFVTDAPIFAPRAIIEIYQNK